MTSETTEPILFRYREARPPLLGYIRSTLRQPHLGHHKLDNNSPARKSSRLHQQIAKLFPLTESHLPFPVKIYHDRWLGSFNNNRTLAELETYEHATKNDWQDGGFRIRYSKENPGLPLLNNTCWHCSYCQSNISQIIQKLGASSHREYNIAKKSSRTWFLVHLLNNIDIAEYVNQNQTFWNMLAIYGTLNAGFLDVDPNDPLREDDV